MIVYSALLEFLSRYLLAEVAQAIAYVLTVAVMAGICVVARWGAKGVLVRAMTRVTVRAKARWMEILLERGVYHRAANLVIPAVIALFAASMSQHGRLLHVLSQIICVGVVVRIFEALLRAADDIYNLYEVSKVRPIHSLLQVVQIAAYLVAGVTVAALLVGKSPLVLLGGIGAATAVTSFIFKDAILGFVAGVQLTGNDLIRIGDWIEVPNYSADGTVVDLSMTTVKVQNFDKTITSIPAYSLVSSAFINWRGMESSGGRRIKRALYVDAADVRLCGEEMIARFRGIALLKDYMDRKLAEIETYNRERDLDLSEPVNGRRITNVGTFRAYITAYLEEHPGIHHGMISMVRQLAPDDRGLPLEIYAFTNTTKWIEYENIQSDIFDHLYSVASVFGLRIYQKPSGSDIRSLGGGAEEDLPSLRWEENGSPHS